MGFDTTVGTRGAKPRGSPGTVSRWIQGWMSRQHRRKGNKFMGMDVVFLTTVGKKTGIQRETPVAWFPDGEEAWLIVASAAGSVENPSWYYNIATHPDQVWIELPQRKLRVEPDQLDGPRREECWKRIVAAQPRYDKYQNKTDRVLPVIRLIPSAIQPEP